VHEDDGIAARNVGNHRSHVVAKERRLASEGEGFSRQRAQAE
jgi:hypothetical protein